VKTGLFTFDSQFAFFDFRNGPKTHHFGVSFARERPRAHNNQKTLGVHLGMRDRSLLAIPRAGLFVALRPLTAPKIAP
jgi:hypothetical protein